jgi:hypothetical protein
MVTGEGERSESEMVIGSSADMMKTKLGHLGSIEERYNAFQKP